VCFYVRMLSRLWLVAITTQITTSRSAGDDTATESEAAYRRHHWTKPLLHLLSGLDQSTYLDVWDLDGTDSFGPPSVSDVNIMAPIWAFPGGEMGILRKSSHTNSIFHARVLETSSLAYAIPIRAGSIGRRQDCMGSGACAGGLGSGGFHKKKSHTSIDDTKRSGQGWLRRLGDAGRVRQTRWNGWFEPVAETLHLTYGFANPPTSSELRIDIRCWWSQAYEYARWLVCCVSYRN
jgi:hypothetical protein